MTPKNDNVPTWFIVYCRPSLDMRAAEEIAALGMTVYVPRLRKESRHPRSKKWEVKYYSILGGYLFVMATKHWQRMLQCEGVVRVLCTVGGSPLPISDDTVKAIRASQEAGDFDRRRFDGRIAEGMEVRVLDGALAGFKGEVAASDDDKVVMLVQMFGREVKARASVELLGQVG